MAIMTTGFLGGFLHRRALRRWQRLEDIARTAGLGQLRRLRRRARSLSLHVNAVAQIAEARLVQPAEGAISAMKLPPATDWSFRPDLWSSPLVPPGHAPIANEARLGERMQVFHDCTLPSLSARQIRNRDPEHLAPFGLSLDVFDFDGSFLSLVIEAPAGIVKDIDAHHILRLDLKAESESPLDLTVRMNLKHGPNTEQVARPLSLHNGHGTAEFDLAYLEFYRDQAEHVWFDLFLDNPTMNQITIHDLTLSRQTRAQV